MEQMFRNDFPILDLKINNKQLIYFDNAATTQKPNRVINAVSDLYKTKNAPIYRGIYKLAENLTYAYEQTRLKIANFFNANQSEIVFTYGATDGINCVAYAWALNNLKSGDGILLSVLEHHSNLLIWQQIAKQKSLKIYYVPVDTYGNLDIQEFDRLLNLQIKLVAISHCSNVFGNYQDVESIIKKSHSVDAKVLIDAAQSAPHTKIDLKKINPDFLVLSAHKMLGPTGFGILYINESLHHQLSPFRLGGGMVYEADYETSSYLKMPRLLEAGTPAVEAAIGFGAAIEYLEENINFSELRVYESKLCSILIDGLESIKKIKILGPVEELKKSGHLVSFVVEGVHPHDIAAFLDSANICVRAGHHCAQPIHKKLGIDGSVRASFYFYNEEFEVDELLKNLEQAIKVLK